MGQFFGFPYGWVRKSGWNIGTDKPMWQSSSLMRQKEFSEFIKRAVDEQKQLNLQRAASVADTELNRIMANVRGKA